MFHVHLPHGMVPLDPGPRHNVPPLGYARLLAFHTCLLFPHLVKFPANTSIYTIYYTISYFNILSYIIYRIQHQLQRLRLQHSHQSTPQVQGGPACQHGAQDEELPAPAHLHQDDLAVLQVEVRLAPRQPQKAREQLKS